MKALQDQLIEAKQAHQQFQFCYDYYDNLKPEMCSVAHHPENQGKNQDNFWGFPYDHNRITSIPEYINASPMEFNARRYIAAQGPRTNTLSIFWNMVMEEKSSLIVSVTNEREEGKPMGFQFKFNRFWPDLGTSIYGDIHVLLHEEQLLHEWKDGRQEKIRQRKLIVKKDQQEAMVTHLHMENWPDSGVVHPESLLALSKCADRANPLGPIIVHCAAGVGRTGTFIAFHSLYHDLMDQLAKGDALSLDVPGRVHEMRKLRWGAMIAELKQYELVIDALGLALNTH